ncbi:MAG: UDP-2,3-diacylglucosamine diphosphatase, partial [Pseudomonadales bacterium]|nr:UDP-2,3-diacylglucosamine diphosphatase [Pseudomonadales bacterium]
LQPERPDLTAAFLEFLQTGLREAEGLYILGDFFEVWLGDDHVSDFNSQIIAALADLNLPLYLMHGNRDFLLGQAFCEQTGATLLQDPATIDLYGRPALLMHGDSLCTLDTEYMQVRSMLRNPDFQAQLLARPITERAALAAGARAESKAHTSNTDMMIMDVTPAEVVNAMEAAGVDLLIHGHTHRPDRHQVELPAGTGERIVLGDWDQNGWALEATAAGLTLKSFPVRP